MTIDKSISWIKKTILDMRRAEICISDRLALETAIDTMRKYQKIEKIIKNAGIFAFDVPEIRRIAEVIKDE